MKNSKKTIFIKEKSVEADEFRAETDSLPNKINQEILQMFQECLPLFQVLSDENRQEIVLIIANAKEEGIMVNAITQQVSLSRPAVSHHLKVLKQSGIIGVKKKGVENYYYLTLLNAVRQFKTLLSAVETNCILH